MNSTYCKLFSKYAADFPIIPKHPVHCCSIETHKPAPRPNKKHLKKKKKKTADGSVAEVTQCSLMMRDIHQAIVTERDIFTLPNSAKKITFTFVNTCL